MSPRKSNNKPKAQNTPAPEESDEQDLENAFEDEQEDVTPSTPSETESPSTESAPVDESIFEADLSEEERIARAAATVNGKVYSFPHNTPESLEMSLALGQTFIPALVKPKQVLSINLHKNAMLFLDQLGTNLNVDNPAYIVPEDITESQKIYITHLVREGAVWLGDFQISKKETAIAVSKLDQKEFLDKPVRELRDDLKELIGQGTKVQKDGTIVSPAVDIKALLEYERDNQNRKDYVDLLKRALNKIHGAVEFIDKMTEVKPVGEVAKGETLPPPGPSNPNAVNTFM